MKSSNTIDAKRDEIDKLDSLLVNLLVDRFDLSKEISHLKKEENVDNYDSKREEKIFENLKILVKEKGDCDKVDHILSIYKTLLTESKLYQSK